MPTDTGENRDDRGDSPPDSDAEFYAKTLEEVEQDIEDFERDVGDFVKGSKVRQRLWEIQTEILQLEGDLEQDHSRKIGELRREARELRRQSTTKRLWKPWTWF